MLEILLKLTFHKIILIQNKLQKLPGIQTSVFMCHLSSPNVKNELVLVIQKVFRKSNPLSICAGLETYVFIHFMKSMLKEPCLGCILSQHSCINPFSSIPHSGLPSCFLSGRVHLRLFKLTGCLMKTLKEKNAVGIPIILFLQREHPPTLKILLPYTKV